MSSGITVTSHSNGSSTGDSYCIDRLQHLSSMVRDKKGDGSDMSKEKLYLQQQTTRITKAPPRGQLTSMYNSTPSNNQSSHLNNSTGSDNNVNNSRPSTTPAGSSTIEESMRNMHLDSQQLRSSNSSTHSSNNSRYDPVTGARRSPLTTSAPADQVQQLERDEDDDLRSTFSHRSNLSSRSIKSTRSNRSKGSNRSNHRVEAAEGFAARSSHHRGTTPSESLSMAEKDFLAKYGHSPNSGNADRGRMMGSSIPGATAVRSNFSGARRMPDQYSNHHSYGCDDDRSRSNEGRSPSGRNLYDNNSNNNAYANNDRSPSRRSLYGQPQMQMHMQPRETGNYRYEEGPSGYGGPRRNPRGSLVREEMSHSTMSTSGFRSFHSGAGTVERGNYQQHQHQYQQQYHPADYSGGRSRGSDPYDDRGGIGYSSPRGGQHQYHSNSRYDEDAGYSSRYGGDSYAPPPRYDDDRYGDRGDGYGPSPSRERDDCGWPGDGSYGGGRSHSNYNGGGRGGYGAASAQPDRPLIEVAPGLFMHLMGTDDTMKAIQRGTITVTSCLCCSTDIHCTEEAEFILCPDCRVVSPVNQLDNRDMSPTNGGLVGLGVKTEMLITMMNGQG